MDEAPDLALNAALLHGRPSIPTSVNHDANKLPAMKTMPYRRTKAGIGLIVTALEAKLEQYPGETDLVDAETWL